MHSCQNSTRCRDGVNALWCRSHFVRLVFERFYMRLFSFGKLFCDLFLLFFFSEIVREVGKESEGKLHDL